MMKKKQKNDRGSMAILVVLTALALITAIGAEIIYRSNVSATLAANRRDGEKAYQLARAAVRWSMFRLKLDTELDKIPVIPNTNYGGKKDDLSEVQWALPISYPFAGVLGSATGEVPKPPEGTPSTEDLGGSFLSVLTDESAKINLNDVGSGQVGATVRWSGAAEILENLLLSYRFRPYFRTEDHREILWAIDDWTDSDSQVNHLGGGIEDSEYKMDDLDLHVKNGPFYSLAEIRYLKPITEELLQELEPFVTVYPFNARLPRIHTQIPPIQGKINVNTAPLELIAALFSRQYTTDPRARLECAQKVVQFREMAAFRSIRGQDPSLEKFLQDTCGFGPTQQGEPPVFSVGVRNVLDVRSDVFLAEATGTAAEVEKTIRAVLSRKNARKIQILYWKVI